MGTLREVRLKAGLTQTYLAEKIKTSTPMISNYENGISLPPLEDMVILEREFGEKIEWKEDVIPKKKHDVIQSIIELCERYPLPAVLEFAARVYRREQSPESHINHYAQCIIVDDNKLFPLGTII